MKGLPGLRAARRSRQLRQADLAEAIGLTVQSISYLENGHVETGSDTIRKIAEVLKCDPGELFRAPEAA